MFIKSLFNFINSISRYEKDIIKADNVEELIPIFAHYEKFNINEVVNNFICHIITGLEVPTKNKKVQLDIVYDKKSKSVRHLIYRTSSRSYTLSMATIIDVINS